MKLKPQVYEYKEAPWLRGQGNQGGAPACSPLPLTAHCCPLLTAHRCLLSLLTAHSSQCMLSSLPLMCGLLSLTLTSHCLQEEEKTSKAAAGKQKEEGRGGAKEETKKLTKAEAKKADVSKKARSHCCTPAPGWEWQPS